mgnify:CR=1 FL=1
MRRKYNNNQFIIASRDMVLSGSAAEAQQRPVERVHAIVQSGSWLIFFMDESFAQDFPFSEYILRSSLYCLLIGFAKY